MPYIAVKAFPRSKEAQIAAAEAISKALQETWGLKPEAITVAFEGVPKEEWNEKVQQPLVEACPEQILIKSGEKKY